MRFALFLLAAAAAAEETSNALDRYRNPGLDRALSAPVRVIRPLPRVAMRATPAVPADCSHARLIPVPAQTAMPVYPVSPDADARMTLPVPPVCKP